MEPTPKALIFVRLLDEGVPVARPTYGEVMGDHIFRLLPTEAYDPEDETWEFPPGSIVIGEERVSPDGKKAVLLAVSLYTK